MNPEHLCVIEEEEEVEEVEEVEEEDSQENREMDLEYLVDNTTTENKKNKTRRCLAMAKMVVCITMVNYLKLLPKHSQIPTAHCSVTFNPSSFPGNPF